MEWVQTIAALSMHLAVPVVVWQVLRLPKPTSEPVEVSRLRIYLPALLGMAGVALLFSLPFEIVARSHERFGAFWLTCLALLLSLVMWRLQSIRSRECAGLGSQLLLFYWLWWGMSWGPRDAPPVVGLTHAVLGLLYGVVLVVQGLRMRGGPKHFGPTRSGILIMFGVIGFGMCLVRCITDLRRGALDTASLQHLDRQLPMLVYQLGAFLVSIVLVRLVLAIERRYNDTFPRDQDDHRYRGSLWSRAEEAAVTRAAAGPSESEAAVLG